MILDPRPSRRSLRIVVAALLLATVGACAGGMQGTAPGSARALPSSDGLLSSPELQAVVDLQVQRNGAALIRLLESPAPLVRARAALALASVQDQAALAPLVARLSDEDPAVRRNAAFAIGQLALPDGGAFLVDAIGSETEPAVRREIVRAIGKRGGTSTLQSLLEMEPQASDEPEWTMALSAAALREIRPPGLLASLTGRLSDPDPEIRKRAAYYFGRTPNTSAWEGRISDIRERLDVAPLDDPAAMHLVSALGRLADIEEDAPRLARWMSEAEDWRTRVNAATSVRTPRWLEAESIREGVLRALEDPSDQVRATAAASLAILMWSSDELFARGIEWVRGSPDAWRVQLAFLSPLASQGELPLVLDWIRRMADIDPVAAAGGIEVVGGFRPASVSELLFDLADHPDPLVRSTVLAELSGRLPADAPRSELLPYWELFSGVVMEAESLPAARAARALRHPAFGPFGAPELAEEAFRSRRAQGNANVLVPLLDAMGRGSIDLLREVVETGDIRLRMAAGATLQRLTGSRVATAGNGPMEPVVDWEYLESVGPAPRVRIQTDYGTVTIRLLTEQAPLTVQAFVQNVQRGAYDGTPFHRVVPNFVAQGGDFTVGDGTGDAGYRLRSEFTQLSFERGVVGMASSGKDTEGSQFYLTHSLQPHLDGGYTAFGWVEAGGGVLDRIQQGDRVIRMRLEDE